MKRVKLQKARYRKGLSQEALAEALGVSRNAVSQWENGHTTPYPLYVGKLCDLFGVDDPVALDLETQPDDPPDLVAEAPAEPLNISSVKQREETKDVSLPSSSTQPFPLPAEVQDVDSVLDPSRRAFNFQILQTLCGATHVANASFLDPDVWERLMTPRNQSSAFDRSVFEAFQQFTTACWRLCDTGAIAFAEQLMAAYLPHVQQLATQHKWAAQLAAEGLRLQSVLSHHQLDMMMKLKQCVQSVAYARLADDSNTLASSLHELTAAMRYTHQQDALFIVFQEALSFSERCSPLVRSGIYAGSAAAFARQKRRKEADFYIHLAEEATAEASEEAMPSLADIDNGVAHVAEYAGLVALELGEPHRADTIFGQFTTSSTKNTLPERNRLEMLNYQGQAALHSGQMEKYAMCLENGIEGAIALQSKKRLAEALDIFIREMPKPWLREQPVKLVVEHFHLLPGE